MVQVWKHLQHRQPVLRTVALRERLGHAGRQGGRAAALGTRRLQWRGVLPDGALGAETPPALSFQRRALPAARLPAAEALKSKCVTPLAPFLSTCIHLA